MRKRTLLTIVLVTLTVTISVLVLILVLILRERSGGEDNLVTAEEVKKKKKRIIDPFAGREVDAVRLVQSRRVLDPSYLRALQDRKKAEQEAAELENAPRGKRPPQPEPVEEVVELVPSYTNIADLVERGYLEEQFKMSFLERVGWRSMQLDTDTEGVYNADPYYEVYLDYRDEEVIIGPVWVVNVETGFVVPRNDMAEFFEFTEENIEYAQELLSRPARVVRAITSHTFESGISLGGVFLLHFVNRPDALRVEGDRIVGWTINHEFLNQYSAYFQWVEGGEHRVARFRFDWKHQKLEPRGLLAIDLMAEGEDRTSETPVDIWPVTYERNLSIPRSERWKGQSKDTCKQAAAKPYCDAFAMVLEQEDFIVAVQWLLTSDKTAVQEFRACVDRKDCKWSTKPDESNPDPEKPELFNIEYEYIIHGEKKKIGFKVNPNKNDITPSDEISRWAFWSVTPRT